MTNVTEDANYTRLVFLGKHKKDNFEINFPDLSKLSVGHVIRTLQSDQQMPRTSPEGPFSALFFRETDNIAYAFDVHNRRMRNSGSVAELGAG